MPFTTAGFLEDIDQAGAMTQLAALADQHLRINGDDLQVPSLNQLIACAGLIDTTVAGRARLVSPSLRVRNNFMIAPLNGQAGAAQEPDSPHALVDLRFSPIKLEVGEQLNAEALANPAAAQDQSVIVWLSDGPVTPLAGDFFTVRATAAATLTANAWTPGTLTFDEDLPRGNYRIVGMRAESAGLVAARLILVGYQWRPGVLGCDLVGDIASPIFRYGQLGEFGVFNDQEPPQVEFLSISTDTAEVVYLDLEKIA